jgi:hypothetical protein
LGDSVTVKNLLAGVIGAIVFAVVCSVSVGAQWSKFPEAGVPRDEKGNVRMDAPAPKTPDGHVDFSGMWMRADSGPPRAGGRGGRQGQGGAQGRGQANAAPAPAPAAGGQPPAAPPAGQPPAPGGANSNGDTNAAFAAGRGGVQLEPPTERFPFDPNGPPVATFFEAGGNMPGGLPYTDWAKEVRKQRFEVDKAKDNPDANCMPMGFLQFHQQPQPRKIIQTSKLILIEYEANYGIRHIYIDGRPLPKQGDPQPWWYGYSVGHWEGDTLVVETNNMRGAEDGPFDGWLDVNGSPYSQQVKFTERFRRPTFGHLQMDITVEDPKAYTKPWTVRLDQRFLADSELIEFVCNENQQFRRRIKID